LSERLLSQENPDLNEVIDPADSPMKEWMVTYVGERFDIEEVTVEMIVDVMANEFPEFLLAIAEENFLRGYSKGLEDAG
tara:strand:- start:654 stop:890 length:237 start_codon:yes stop_codon:yes gene_type:complete